MQKQNKHSNSFNKFQLKLKTVDENFSVDLLIYNWHSIQGKSEVNTEITLEICIVIEGKGFICHQMVYNYLNVGG